MDPITLIIWAVCLGFAWLLFASITGVDEWLKNLLGKSKTAALEQRVRSLESRLEALEKQKAG
jgi:hypothetical protein